MPFVFFGARPVRQRLGGGEFFCPQCRTRRPYRLMRAQNHAHLYWVPLFRLGQSQDYVECGECRGRFHPEVLEQRAAHDGHANEGRVRKTLAWAAFAAMRVVTRDSTPSDAERRAITDALGGILGAPQSPEVVEQALAAELGSRDDAVNRLARLEAAVPVAAREALMQAVLVVATAGGAMTPAQADTVQRLAEALGITSAHLKGIMVELAERRGRVRT